MANDSVKTGDSIYGGKYAQNSDGRIGYGPSEAAALQALNSAQSRGTYSETVRTGNSIYGGTYAEDNHWNIGYGPSEAAALQALDSAQSRGDS